MSTGPDFVEIASQHGAVVVDDFLANDLHAECACGWVGDKIPPGGPSQVRLNAAFADHAAHVHVAAGLAEEDE